MIFVPLAGAFAVLAMPESMVKAIRRMAVAASAIAMAVSCYVWWVFDRSAETMQLVEKAAWVPAFSINYHLGVDGLSVTLVALTALLTLVSVIYSFNIEFRIKEFFFWVAG